LNSLRTARATLRITLMVLCMDSQVEMRALLRQGKGKKRDKIKTKIERDGEKRKGREEEEGGREREIGKERGERQKKV